MALRGAYRLPKDIGEMALRFIKDGMEPGQALGTARMLSNDPQDPAAKFYTEDLMKRLQKSRLQGEDLGPDMEYPVGGSNLMRGLLDRPLAHTTRDWKLRGSNVSYKPEGAAKTVIPRTYKLPARVAGAERRLVAEVANAAAAGDRNAFLEILAELGFRERIARPLADRYAPKTIEYNPAKEKRIKWQE